ncbi:MAG TPA: hypothetical protein VGD02_12675 [Gemmatimonadaceae bacterium]|jgi:hypothetical protein
MSGRKWIYAGAAVVIVSAAIFWQQRTRNWPAPDASPPVADSLLNIPLSRTVAARQEFLRVYRASRQTQRPALYAKFLPLIGANGIREALEKANRYCHAEAHDLGKLIFARLHDVGQSLESCADACSSGCMHGVLMEFFTSAESTATSTHQDMASGGHVHSAQLTAGDVAQRIPTFCESPAVTRMYGPGDCAHGVGHAAMFLSNYKIKDAMDLCERFTVYGLRFYCATGAYMEYRIQPRFQLEYWQHGPFFPCENSPYPAACFRYVLTSSIRWHYAQGGTIETLASKCSGLAGKFRIGCFHGIGFAHIPQLQRGQRTLAQVCGLGSRDDQTVCLEGAMEHLGQFNTSVPPERCESLTDWRREVCRAAAARQKYDLGKSFALYQR